MRALRAARGAGARRRAVGLALVVVGSTSAVAGCACEGTISVANSAGAVVVVRGAEETFGPVEPDGGLAFSSDDCVEGPLVVTYPGGEEIVFDAPLCPGQELLVERASVQVVAPSHG